MSYDYQTERPRLFTEDGQVMFLAIRDAAFALIREAGAARAQEILSRSKTGGSSWQQLACLDRLVELKEIIPVTLPGSVWGQHQIFTRHT